MFTAWNSRRMDLLKRQLGTLPKDILAIPTFGIITNGTIDNENGYHHFKVGSIVRVNKIEESGEVFCAQNNVYQLVNKEDIVLC